MTIQLNRLQARSAALTRQTLQNSKNDRKARTRTLIQLGGLLHMIGLTSYVGIEDGDDLQLDGDKREKSAVLLGILTEKMRELPAIPTTDVVDSWKQVGIHSLKKHQAKKYHFNK